MASSDAEADTASLSPRSPTTRSAFKIRTPRLPTVRVAIGLLLAFVGGVLYFTLPHATTHSFLETAVAAATPLLLAAGSSFTVLGLGDWGRGGTWGQTNLAATMGAYCVTSALNCTSVFSVGDNFYVAGISGGDDPQLRSSFEDVYTHPSLQIPWHVTSGNHDQRGSVEAQLHYKGLGARKWIYHGGLPETEVFPIPGGDSCVSVVFIDTVPLIPRYRESPDTPQMAATLALNTSQPDVAWPAIEAAIDSAVARCVCVWVVGHHPVYSAAEHGDAPSLARLAVAMRGRVQLYLSGHDHTVQLLREEEGRGTLHMISGAGSDLRPSVMAATPQLRWAPSTEVNAFSTHSVNSTHAVHSFVAASGAVMHSMTVPHKGF